MPKHEEQSRILFERNVGTIFCDWLNKKDQKLFDLILNQSRGVISALFRSHSMEEPIINILDVREVNAYAMRENGYSFIAVTPGIFNGIQMHIGQLLKTKSLGRTLKIDENDLVRLVMIFLIGHEAGHLILGHLDSAIRNLRAEFGFYAGNHSEVDSVVEEIAADRFGADFLFNYLK